MPIKKKWGFMIGIHEWGLYDFTVFTALYPCFLSDKGMLCYVWNFGGIHSLIIQLIKVCALTVEEIERPREINQTHLSHNVLLRK